MSMKIIRWIKATLLQVSPNYLNPYVERDTELSKNPGKRLRRHKIEM